MAEEEGGTKAGGILGVLAIALLVLFGLAYFTPTEKDEYVKYGVKVVSEFPLDEMRYRQYLAIYNDTKTASELTCKFELSAVSQPDPKGYRVRIEEGDYGVYLGAKEAYIKGRTGEELLNACHAFACLKDDIDCDEFHKIDYFIRNLDSVSVILDESVGDAGGRGYAEVMGALSFLQTKKVDVNRDGVVGQAEIDANNFFIYPFLRSNNRCTTQPFNTLVQNWTRKNETVDCSKITPAIIIMKSNESELMVWGERLVLSGEDEQIHTESIILRDIIAPEWIRRIYGYK